MWIFKTLFSCFLKEHLYIMQEILKQEQVSFLYHRNSKKIFREKKSLNFSKWRKNGIVIHVNALQLFLNGFAKEHSTFKRRIWISSPWEKCFFWQRMIQCVLLFSYIDVIRFLDCFAKTWMCSLENKDLPNELQKTCKTRVGEEKGKYHINHLLLYQHI